MHNPDLNPCDFILLEVRNFKICKKTEKHTFCQVLKQYDTVPISLLADLHMTFNSGGDFVAKSCDLMHCSPPGSSVHGILQVRILEWLVISFSRGSSWLKDQTWVSFMGRWIFTTEPPGKPFGGYFSALTFRLLIAFVHSAVSGIKAWTWLWCPGHSMVLLQLNLQKH